MDTEDYLPIWEKNITHYSKQTHIKGFRQGHAPRNVVKKRYGQRLLHESIFQVAHRALVDYIRSQRLAILGTPLVKKNSVHTVSGKEPCSIAYIIGLEPPFELPKADTLKVSSYQVTTVEEDNLSEIIEHIRKSYATFDLRDTVAHNHILQVAWHLDGQAVEAPYYINLNEEAASLHDAFLHKKVGDIIPITTEAFSLLKELNPLPEPVTKAMVEQPKASLALALRIIYHSHLPPLDKDFYTQVLGGTIETEDEFREKLTQTILERDQERAQRLLYHTLRDTYLEAVDLPLPDEILKVWLLAKEDNALTAANLDAEYPAIAKAIRWELISDRLAEEHGLAPSAEEVRASLVRTLSTYEEAEATQIEERAKSLIQHSKNELGGKIERQLKEQKVLDWIQSQARLTAIPMSSKDFYEMLEQSGQENI